MDQQTPLSPEEIAARNQEAIDILDYRPDIREEKIPGQPGDFAQARALLSSSTSFPSSTEPLSRVHLVNTVALIRDVATVANWFSTTQALYEQELSGVQLSISSSSLSNAQQSAVREFLNGDVITFQDYKNALQFRNLPIRQYILKAWNSYHFSLDGRIDALFYADIYRYNTSYIPDIQLGAKALLFVTAHTILGYIDNGSLDIDAALNAIQKSIDNNDQYDNNPDRLSGIVNLQKTLASATSHANDIARQQNQVYEAQTNLCAEARQIVNTLGQGFSTVTSTSTGIDNTVNQALHDISSLISILQGIRILLTLYNDGMVLNFLSLESQLDQLLDQLVTQVLMKSISVIAGLQGTIMQPLTNLLLQIDTALAGRLPNTWNQYAGAMTTTVESILGKFYQNILDWYRHQWIHNQLTSDKTVKIQGTQQAKNILTILDHVIAFLQTVETSDISGHPLANPNIPNSSGQTGWDGVGNTICQSISVTPMVAPPPTPKLIASTPPASISLPDLAMNHKQYGLQAQGSATDIVSGLLADIDILNTTGEPQNA